MKSLVRFAIALGIGLALVGAFALYGVASGDWERFYLLCGIVGLAGFVIAGLMARPFRDKHRPPGMARVHAASVTARSPETLTAAERRYQPGDDPSSVVDEGLEHAHLTWWPIVIAGPAGALALWHFFF